MSKRKLREPVKKQVAYNQEYKCFICSCLLPPTFQVDHVVPHSITFDDSEGNLQALCNSCHSRKTQKESMRILEFKKLQAFSDEPLCWFCLKATSPGHMCKRETVEVHIAKPATDTLLEPFSRMCNQHIFTPAKAALMDKTLRIEILMYATCIYVNQVIYKCPRDDVCIDDIAEAVSLATRTKKDSGRYNSIEVKLTHKNEDSATEEENEACSDYISENLLSRLPERIFEKGAKIFILVEY